MMIHNLTAILPLAALACLQSMTATLVWKANPPEEKVVEYWCYYSGNGINGRTNAGNKTSLDLSFLPGTNTYTLYLTAVSASGLESDPSEAVFFAPGVTIPPSPDIADYSGKRVPGTKNWTLVVEWDPVDPKYEVGGYYCRVVQDALTPLSFTTNTSFQVTMPGWNPTLIQIWATNYMGLSSVPLVKEFTFPGRPEKPWKSR